MNERNETRAADIVSIERLLLMALCQTSLPARNREEVLRRLDSHQFRDPEHEVLFLALSKVSGRHGERLQVERHWEVLAELRREVGACLTRLGFPDFDLEPFFNPASPVPSLGVPEVAALLQRL